MRRLQKMKNDRAKRAVHLMSVRVAASSLGYVLFAVIWILYIVYAGLPWGVQLTLNGAFLGDNIAGMLQVVAIRPIHPNRKVRKRSSATASSSDNIKGTGRHDYGTSGGTLRTVENPDATQLVDTRAASTESSSSSDDVDSDNDSIYQTDVEAAKHELLDHHMEDDDDTEEDDTTTGSGN